MVVYIGKPNTRKVKWVEEAGKLVKWADEPGKLLGREWARWLGVRSVTEIRDPSSIGRR